MHIVRISAGLGNQMFEYAFALVLEELYGGVKLDLGWFEGNKQHNGYELARLFELRLPVASREEVESLGDLSMRPFDRARRRFLWTRGSHHRERGRGYDPYYLKAGGDCYFAGYWQSYRYFLGREALVREALRFVPKLGPASRGLIAANKGRALVGLHVRRGDYASKHSIFHELDREYYRRALEESVLDRADPLVLVFSDDLDWCRNKLVLPGDAVFIDWNRADSSYEDMRLMSLCDSLVTCNSTFSWWGAWLGQAAGRRVYAPCRWFARPRPDNPDIIPPEWIRIGK